MTTSTIYAMPTTECIHPRDAWERDDTRSIEEVWGVPKQIGQLTTFCTDCGDDITDYIAMCVEY